MNVNTKENKNNQKKRSKKKMKSIIKRKIKISILMIFRKVYLFLILKNKIMKILASLFSKYQRI